MERAASKVYRLVFTECDLFQGFGGVDGARALVGIEKPISVYLFSSKHPQRPNQSEAGLGSASPTLIFRVEPNSHATAGHCHNGHFVQRLT
jgi:hypothetical protein